MQLKTLLCINDASHGLTSGSRMLHLHACCMHRRATLTKGRLRGMLRSSPSVNNNKAATVVKPVKRSGKAGAAAARQPAPSTTSAPVRRRSSVLDVDTSDVDSVEELFTRLKLTKYLPNFKCKDLPTLAAMNEAQLKDAGLALFGPRRKLFVAAQQWKDEHPAA